MTLGLSKSPHHQLLATPRSQSGLAACPLPTAHLVGPDQRLHSQVVLHQLAGLGPARDCRPALRDDRGDPWLSQATRGFLAGFPEKAVPGLGRDRSKKTARSGPARSQGWPRLGAQGVSDVPHHHSSQGPPRTLPRRPSQQARALTQSPDLCRTQLGRGAGGAVSCDPGLHA